MIDLNEYTPVICKGCAYIEHDPYGVEWCGRIHEYPRHIEMQKLIICPRMKHLIK